MALDEDDDLAELAARAGVPSNASRKRLELAFGAFGVTAGLIVVAFSVRDCVQPMLAPTLAEISLEALDRPAEVRRRLPAGKVLWFGVEGWIERNGKPEVFVEAETFRDGVEVGRVRCMVSSGRSSRGHDAGWTYVFADRSCNLPVPEGGITAIRATVTKGPNGSVNVDHARVLVKGL